MNGGMWTKKFIWVTLMLTSFVILFLAALIAIRNSKARRQEVSLSDMVNDNGEFCYLNYQYGETIESIEQNSNYNLPEVPLYSDEWFNSRDMVEYWERRSTTTRNASFLAYVKDNPLRIYYKYYCGHLLFEFNKGRLSSTCIIFGRSSPAHDWKANYGGQINDLDSLYDTLCIEAEELFGAQNIDRYKAFGKYDDLAFWVSDSGATSLTIEYVSITDDPLKSYVTITVSEFE